MSVLAGDVRDQRLAVERARDLIQDRSTTLGLNEGEARFFVQQLGDAIRTLEDVEAGDLVERRPWR